jgi:hypothetical protein
VTLGFLYHFPGACCLLCAACDPVTVELFPPQWCPLHRAHKCIFRGWLGDPGQHHKPESHGYSRDRWDPCYLSLLRSSLPETNALGLPGWLWHLGLNISKVCACVCVRVQTLLMGSTGQVGEGGLPLRPSRCHSQVRDKSDCSIAFLPGSEQRSGTDHLCDLGQVTSLRCVLISSPENESKSPLCC